MQNVLYAGALVAIGIAMTGCGGGGGGTGAGYRPPVSVPAARSTPGVTPTNAPGSAATTTGFAGDAKQMQVNGQTIFVDASTGLALYFFNGDAPNQSNCAGGCLAIWPAHAASASETGSANFTTFTRTGGSLQWAYKGRPLYTFVSDSASNNATGNNFQNFVLATP